MTVYGASRNICRKESSLLGVTAQRNTVRKFSPQQTLRQPLLGKRYVSRVVKKYHGGPDASTGRTSKYRVSHPFQLLCYHRWHRTPRPTNKACTRSTIQAYLISQRCLVKMERRPVALAHVKRDVTGFEGLLHAQLAAAHQPGRYTSARVNGGCARRVGGWAFSVQNGHVAEPTIAFVECLRSSLFRHKKYTQGPLRHLKRNVQIRQAKLQRVLYLKPQFRFATEQLVREYQALTAHAMHAGSCLGVETLSRAKSQRWHQLVY